MWITKKKLESKLRDVKVETMREEWKSQSEIDQEKRLAKIEKAVKKLQKQVKNGW